MLKKFVLYLLLSSFLYANNLNNQKHILILHSYHKSMAWVNNIEKAIFDVLKPDVNNYVLHTEYMDTKRIFSQDYLDNLREIYKVKYKNIKFDLILSSDNNAFDFLRKYRDNLFGNVPVSFSGVNDFKEQYLDGLTNFTGAVEVFNVKETLTTALKLFPKTKNIYIINDYLTTGRAWRRIMKEELKDFKENIMYAPNISLSELQKQLKTLPKNTLVLLGGYFKDKNGTYITYEKMGELIAKNSKIPIFCLLEFNLRGDIIGGNLISGYQQGKLQSEIGKMILEGVPASSIPIKTKGITRYIFNYNSLKKYDIDFNKLPKDSLFINKPITFYEKHKPIIIISSIIILLLLCIIFILLYNIERRKEVQNQLLKTKDEISSINETLEEKIEERTKSLEKAYEDISQYKHFFEQSRTIMLLVEPKTGKIVDANESAVNFYGYSYKELLNMNISEINSLSYQEIKEETEKAKKEMQNHFFFEHKLKNNTVKSVEVLSGPIVLGDKELVYSIIHDVTEHKEHENILKEQSKLASMSEMIGNIAHQWRQPLSVISTASSGMKLQIELNVFNQEEAIKTCNYINNNAQYLSKTIDSFTNFIKKQHNPSPFNLKETINSSMHILEGSIKDQDIQVVLENNEDITLEGYENELIQSLINIFNNSKDKLSEKGIKEKYIFISTLLDGDKVKITIKDNANGIPKDIIDKIFEPYFTTKHQSQGTGLGLHITHNLITSMKGSIQVQNVDFVYNNQPLKGAEFSIILPISLLTVES